MHQENEKKEKTNHWIHNLYNQESLVRILAKIKQGW
jgi:hypothetical protein